MAENISIGDFSVSSLNVPVCRMDRKSEPLQYPRAAICACRRDASAGIWMEELEHLDDEPKQAAGGFLGGSWEAFAAQMSRQ